MQALQRVKNIWLRELIAALPLFLLTLAFCLVFKELQTLNDDSY
ncbi:hypothetical protein B4110_3713 [Parageobacillus toebii]|uniref:Uncharacterized protein n=1 Tax=Parageobacillus toebii TaxID=153151 RepID=A0A150MX36_9BACL|nr:hypothetical protein B4110_3713 [Parageobacillus toebii]